MIPQKLIARLAVIGSVMFFISEFWYYFDWFSVSKVIFIRNGSPYSLREIILNSDDLILLMFLFYGIRRATHQIWWSKYFTSLMMDLIFTSILYTVIFSPDIESWNRWSLIFIAFLIFTVQIVIGKLRK